MSDREKIIMPDGFYHQAFLSIDSTNKEAARQIDGGAGSGLWITADEQTGGRGRGGRNWVSKLGNLFCSLILETGNDIRKSSELSFVTSLAVRDTIGEFIDPAAVKCKWPNDVLVNGHKICGILLESHSKANVQFMIIGAGINVNHHPDVTLYQTTHLNAEVDGTFSHIDVFSVLTEKMAIWVQKWQEKGFSVIREEWLENSIGLGEVITVKLPNEQLIGRFIDLDHSGALKLEINNKMKLIHSGDVFFTGQESE